MQDLLLKTIDDGHFESIFVELDEISTTDRAAFEALISSLPTKVHSSIQQQLPILDAMAQHIHKEASAAKYLASAFVMQFHEET
jgi:hypothetical protein